MKKKNLLENIERMKTLSGIEKKEIINETDYINKAGGVGYKLVEINYNGTWIKAVELGFSQGPFFMTKYVPLEDVVIDFHDFNKGRPGHEIIRDLNPQDLVLKK